MVRAAENRPLTSIRGLAAAWVVWHHAQPLWFPAAPARLASLAQTGRLAVDIFFILSGFILATVYAGIGLDQAPEFWLRRICRVYPLHVAVLAGFAALVLVVTAHNGNWATLDWASFVSVLFLVQVFTLADTPWNPPSWSIGVELVCYALFPFISRIARHLPGVALAGLIVALAGCEVWVLCHHDGATVGAGALLRGLAGFHLGAMLGWLAPLLAPRLAPVFGTRWLPVGAWIGMAGLLGAIAIASPSGVALSSALLIVSLSGDRGFLAAALRAGWCVWLGRVSFSLYLLHIPLIFMITRLGQHVRLGQHIRLGEHVPLSTGRLTQAALFVVILLPLSEITYRWIEQPGRRLPGWLARRRAAAGPRPAAPYRR